MKETTIVIEAETLKEAKDLIESRIPEGFHLLSMQELSNGGPQTIHVGADTMESAIAKAQSQIPIDATVLSKMEVSTPELKVIEVDAFSENDAIKIGLKAQTKYDSASVKNIKLLIPGAKGLLGFGRKPNRYEVELFQEGFVEITYKTKAKICAEIVEIGLQTDAAKTLQEAGVSVASPLIEALKDKHSYTIRRAVAGVLGQVGDIRAVDALIAALKDSDEYTRMASAASLGEIGDVRAVDPLIKALKDQDMNVRWFAAKALGKIGDVRAVDPLVTVLKDRDVYMRWIIAEVQEGIERYSQLGDGHFSDSFIERLRDVYNNAQWAAAWALGKIGSARAINPLIEALKSKDIDLHPEVAKALQKIGNESTINGVCVALKDSDEGVRETAALALAEIGLPAVDPLLAVLNDSNVHVWGLAATALGEIGDARVIEPLIRALEIENSYVRTVAATVLGRMGDARAVEPLITALKNANSALVALALQGALSKRDAQTLASLRIALRDCEYIRTAATTALVQIGVPAVDALITALKDKDSGVGKAAAHALEAIGDVRAIQPLREALKNKDKEMQQAVADALKKLDQLTNTSPVQTESAKKAGMTYFSAPRGPLFRSVCSDQKCPCPENEISWGAGFLYISQEVVDFRNDALTQQDLETKVERLKQSGGFTFLMVDEALSYPILVCEEAAKLRNLDLDIAAADAKHWWETELVPLRATPLAGIVKKD